MSAIVQSLAVATASAGASTSVGAISAVTAGSILIAFGYFNTAGTRSFSSNGSGTWTVVAGLDDGSARAIWICKNPGTNNTQVTANNGGVNSHMTWGVVEISGCDSSATPQSIVWANAGSNTTWATGNLNLAAASFAVAVCTQAANGSSACTAGSTPAGMAGFTGTGFSTGNNFNSAEGDTLFAEGGAFSAGNVNGQGTWAISVLPIYAMVALANVSGGGGTGGSSAMLGSAIMAC